MPGIGSVCAPLCKGGSCPEDSPRGVSAKPSCLIAAPGGMRCALVCQESKQCGPAECVKGLCAYGDGVQIGNVAAEHAPGVPQEVIV